MYLPRLLFTERGWALECGAQKAKSEAQAAEAAAAAAAAAEAAALEKQKKEQLAKTFPVTHAVVGAAKTVRRRLGRIEGVEGGGNGGE